MVCHLWTSTCYDQPIYQIWNLYLISLWRYTRRNKMSKMRWFWVVRTDWQTDRPRYSVSKNRRSAQWRSQILLLSTATTSIYWSSRLDRSDQLQQSAAIFSCKTRQVAVYEETNYNKASNTAFPTGVPDRWHNCLLINWRTSCLAPAFDGT